MDLSSSTISPVDLGNILQSHASPTTISALPPKVLLVIFQFAMGTSASVLPPRPLDVKTTLCQVSRAWSSLISASPQFWSHFFLYPNAVIDPEALQTLTVKLLKRRRGGTLHLTFCDRPDGLPNNAVYNPTNINDLMYARGDIDVVSSILTPFAAQISTLSLIVCTERVIKSFLAISPASFSHLISANIAFINDIQVDNRVTTLTNADLTRFTVFQSLPALRAATIRIFNGMYPQWLRLPWAQLLGLDLSSTAMSPSEFLEIIRDTSPSLVEGNFQIEFTGAIWMKAACGCRLERLCLRLMEPSKDETMFGRLILPVLRELRVELYEPSRGWMPSLIADMLKHSSNTMTVLILEEYPPVPASPDNWNIPHRIQRNMSYTEFNHLFSTIPNLCRLHLPFRLPMNMVTLSNIARGTLLPSLRVLSLSSLDGYYILSAIYTRNELADYAMYTPGTSDMHVRPTSHASLSNIILSVPSADKQKLNRQRDSMKGLVFMRDTTIEIVGKDMRYFLK